MRTPVEGYVNSITGMSLVIRGSFAEDVRRNARRMFEALPSSIMHRYETRRLAATREAPFNAFLSLIEFSRHRWERSRAEQGVSAQRKNLTSESRGFYVKREINERTASGPRGCASGRWRRVKELPGRTGLQPQTVCPKAQEH